MTKPISKISSSDEPAEPIEESHIHTRILRFQLGVDESRAYWSSVEDPRAERSALEAFNQRWFGSVSENRAKIIMRDMRARYDAIPVALSVLSRWRDMRPATRILICHWHLQLSDPLYRRFTADYLVERREIFDGTVDRERVIRWVDEQQPERWGRRTRVEFASKLLTAAHAAGLVETTRDPRPLIYPRITDVALSYLLHLLREVRIDATIVDNPYLRSVGLTGKFLEDRVRILPGVTIRKMGDLLEFESSAPDLKTWAIQTLGTSELA